MGRLMKDSGIEWLGEIPNEWEVRRLKFLCNITTGNKDTINKVPEGKYPFYVRSPQIERINTYSFDGEAILTAGDGVGAGRVFHYVNGKFDYHQRVYNLHNFKGINAQFLYYYMKNNFQKEIDKGSAKSTVDSIRLPMLLNFPICIAKKDQETVVDFLNTASRTIDTIVKKQTQLIEKYKNYKQAIITETVTKGLNPNVEIKDSKIEWIGMMPKHWQTKKIKYVFEINKVIANEDGYDILSVTQQGIKIKDISKNEGQIAQDYTKYQVVEKYDFIMNHMDLLTGWVDCSIYKGVTSPDYRVFRLRDVEDNNIEYHTYILQTCYSNRIFYGLGQGVSNLGRWRLQTDSFNNFLVPIPPLEEQKMIVTYLKEKCSLIDNIIEQKQRLIEELETYKKSLIYECVTGKREIPDTYDQLVDELVQSALDEVAIAEQ